MMRGFIPRVKPVLDYSVRELCARPYPGHPKGCPNYGKRPSCPPAAPLLGRVLDLRAPIWAIFNAFDFAGHVERMRERHPAWSQRQLECCLYWQGTARKALRLNVEQFREEMAGVVDCRVVYTPEACGVDVTATMGAVGVYLEWPPRTVAYQVALAGKAANE